MVQYTAKFISVLCLITYHYGFGLGEVQQELQTPVNNLIVEYLAIIDSTVYNRFLNLYGLDTNQEQIASYIRNYFEIVVNAVNDRLQTSLGNDQYLGITVSLVDVLILNDPSLTPWTNASIVAVPGYPTWNGTRTLLGTASMIALKNAMQNINLPYTYDYAVAYVDLDIWTNNQAPPIQRTALTSLTTIGAICQANRYSLMEFQGFVGINDAAHNFGTILGAGKDGSGKAIACPASANYIMTPVAGYYGNSNNFYYYSKCSINSFKSTLLTSNMENVSGRAKCLLNEPSKTVSDSVISSSLPGQLISIDQQCMFINGENSNYINCAIHNDTICRELSCYQTDTKQCTSAPGFGVLDGTPCLTNGDKSKNVCYRGNCVDVTTISNYNFDAQILCAPNPCQNNGQCVINGSSFTCLCAPDYLGRLCTEKSY